MTTSINMFISVNDIAIAIEQVLQSVGIHPTKAPQVWCML